MKRVRKKKANKTCRGGPRLTVDEGVQDGHGTVGDTSVGVDLLENYGWEKDASVKVEMV